jgi:hypothetical protein
VGLPTLATDVLERAIGEENDVAVIGTAPSLEQLSEIDTPDVVIVGVTDSDLPNACVPLFGDLARVKVLGVELSSGHAYLHELQVVHREYANVSARDILDTIRSVARRPLN